MQQGSTIGRSSSLPRRGITTRTRCNEPSQPRRRTWGSWRRAEALLGYLRDRGVADEALARVRAPAGLDLGRIPNQEIAVAILAELVRSRASGELGPARSIADARHETIDPVCGMTVDVATARYRAVHEAHTYYFCSAGCLERFTSSPAE